MEKVSRRHEKVRPLLIVMRRLGFKTARPGLVVHFAGKDIKVPGVYFTTKVSTSSPTMGAGVPLSTGGDAA